jgi:septin family protein
MPFAVVGANAMVEVKGKKLRGRQYPWGIVEVENPAHCDFVKLRTMLITHMQDLQVSFSWLLHWPTENKSKTYKI